MSVSSRRHTKDAVISHCFCSRLPIFIVHIQIEQDSNINDQSPHTHIANIGRMVEDMENKIRNTLNEIYFSKTKDIVNGLRSIQSLSDQKAQAAMKQDLAAALLRRNVKNDN